MTAFQIRRAEPSEGAQLSAIALESKRHWGYPAEWMSLWRESLTITPGYIAQNHVYLAEDKSGVAGFYSLVPGSRWELDHLWIRPAMMRQGVGTLLFQHAAACLARLAPGSTFGIEADPHAEQFYLRMGARRVSEIRRNWSGLIRILPYFEFTPEADQHRYE